MHDATPLGSGEKVASHDQDPRHEGHEAMTGSVTLDDGNLDDGNLDDGNLDDGNLDDGTAESELDTARRDMAVVVAEGPVPTWFNQLVHAESLLGEDVAPEDRAVLVAHPARWRAALVSLLDDTDAALETARRLPIADRGQVIADFESELVHLDNALARLIGPAAGSSARAQDVFGPAGEEDDDEDDRPTLPAQLHLSWTSGNVVAWAGGPGGTPEDEAGVRQRLVAAGAPSSGWTAHDGVPIPGVGNAPAVVTSLASVLGWLIGIGTDPTVICVPTNDVTVDAADAASMDGPLVGTSVRWIGQAVAIGVQLVARGRMVPQLRRSGRSRGANDRSNRQERSEFAVEWIPALVDDADADRLAGSLPGAVIALHPGLQPHNAVQSVLTDVVSAIATTAARRLEVPAPPPQIRSKTDVSEAFLARLDGTAFETPAGPSGELARRLEQWARPVLDANRTRLVVQLSSPDSGGAWHLGVFIAGADGMLSKCEDALLDPSPVRRKEVGEQLDRVERLLPALRRPGRRTGEVVLSQTEAWALMTAGGAVLEAAGFEVRVPRLARRKATASLRLTSIDGQESVVGAQQLANVRWSAVFDDVELDAEAIRRLAAQARPMVKSRGRWVELDRADLAEAAAALSERANTTKMTGAAMLRHALGLEGSPFSGGVTVAGSGWAAELMRSASELPESPTTKPDRFGGELRSYQADAFAWLSFLDSAGLGGCLALDMGLGKTPTVLAHLGAHRGDHPSMVIAPPAVVGNWAAEAARFTPHIKVLVHHGALRSSSKALADRMKRADLLITTYGTAVRDVDALAAIEWDRVVLDEAQVIKNPTSETAQQLRRIPSRTRVALTGTPIENGLGDLWAILDYTNPDLVGPRATFVSQLSKHGDAQGAAESALRALNGLLVFRRTKAEPAIAAELPDRIDELDHCTMTQEQIGLYQAVLDELVLSQARDDGSVERKGAVLAAITALKQICNHPEAYKRDGGKLEGRSGKLSRLEEIVDQVFASGERILVFTHFAQWGEKLSKHLSARTGLKIDCYHGGLARGARDKMVADFQKGQGPGALVLSLKAGGTGLNLTAASHVVLYDRWWNPAVEDQARDRVWRIGQTKTVICHRLVCPGTVDERVEEVVAGKRQIADLVLPKSSSIGDLNADQLRMALGLAPEFMLVDDEAEQAVAADASAPTPSDEELVAEVSAGVSAGVSA